MTPWPDAPAERAALPPPDARTEATPSTAEAYAAKAGRAAAERAARAALVAAARAARDRIGRAQSEAADAGRLGEVAQLEVMHGRLGRLVDRLSTPQPLGAWLDAALLPAGAAAWLADMDRRIAASLRDVALRADGGDGPDMVAALADGLGDAAAQVDARRAALAAARWSPPPSDEGLGHRLPGDALTVEGRPSRIREVVRFTRGDVAAALDDGLVLWEDSGGGRLAFEAAAATVPQWPPPEVIELADDTFRSAWGDDGTGIARGPMGRRWVARPRRLFVGDGGGWLWLAEVDGRPAAWRGAPVAP